MRYLICCPGGPDDKQKRVRICIDAGDGEGNVLNVSFGTYTSLGSPGRGDLISDKNFSDLQFEDETYRALKKAVTYLTAADKSTYYTLTCVVKDMAGNEISQMLLSDGERYEKIHFSINRNGSTYAINEPTEQLINRYYVQNVKHDVVTQLDFAQSIRCRRYVVLKHTEDCQCFLMELSKLPLKKISLVKYSAVEFY